MQLSCVRTYRRDLTDASTKYSENIADHAPPILGEPLPIELANTRFKRRGSEVDGLQTPADLADWLLRVAARLPIAPTQSDLDTLGPVELAAARSLRDALRTLFAEATVGGSLDGHATAILNRTIRVAPRWQELSVQAPPEPVTHTAAPPVTAALAAIAEHAVSLLAGPDAESLRACAGPGCILFYRQDHPRRAWCSPRCSDRARAARHYARRTGTSTTGPTG